MKKTLILVLALVMLVGTLTACSGTASIDPYYGYSNVSTTDDGRVNGTNGASGYGARRSYASGDYSTAGSGMNSGSYGTTDTNRTGYDAANSTARTGSSYHAANGTTRTNGTTYTGTTSGTGMAGGR